MQARILLVGVGGTGCETPQANSLRAELEGEGIEIAEAALGPEIVEIVQKLRPQVAIIDFSPHEPYVRDVISAVRASDPMVRILLVCEAPLDAGMHRFLHDLDVDGMVRPQDDKDRCLLAVRAALRAYKDRNESSQQREALSRALDSLTDLNCASTPEEMLGDLLERLRGVFGEQTMALAAVAHSRLHSRRMETVEGRNGLRIVASSPDSGRNGGSLLPSLRRHLRDRKLTQDGNRLFLPLHSGKEPVGIIYLEHATECHYDKELLRVLSMGIGQALEIRRLTSMSSEDELTHVFTRALFFKMAEASIQSACREEDFFSLAVLDVDYFKKINDTKGHLVGDKVLREIGQLLKANLRPLDFVGRFGGDEFMIALPRTTGNRAAQIMERLRSQVEGAFHELRATISCGVVGLDCTQIGACKPVVINCCAALCLFDKLLNAADRLLYRSKARGRNCVSVEEDYHLSVLSAQLGLPTAKAVPPSAAAVSMLG